MTQRLVARALLKAFDEADMEIEQETGASDPRRLGDRFAALLDGDWRRSVAIKTEARRVERERVEQMQAACPHRWQVYPHGIVCEICFKREFGK
jgi:hypothetical protein